MLKEWSKDELTEYILREYFPSKKCDYYILGPKDGEIVSFFFSSPDMNIFSDIVTPGWTHSGVLTGTKHDGTTSSRIDFCILPQLNVVKDPLLS